MLILVVMLKERFFTYVIEKQPIVVLLIADRPAELVNAWTADTKNTTRRDWRAVKLNNDYVEWPTGHNISKRFVAEDINYNLTSSYADISPVMRIGFDTIN